MKIHTKNYMTHFGYTIADFIPCEVCGMLAVDIHHIESKGMGGSKTKDNIENLIALCRDHHVMAHKHLFTKQYLKSIHTKKLESCKT